MSKQGMARPEWTHTRPHNSQSPVPEIQGKAKHGKQKANPIIPGTSGADLKVFHSKPFPYTTSLLDTDLGRDNLTNDLPAADLEDWEEL